MPCLYLANCCFEQELENEAMDFSQLIPSSIIYQQLQFLPFLYANNQDYILAFNDVDQQYLAHLNKLGLSVATIVKEPPQLPKTELDVWGVTPQVIKWAQSHSITTSFPPPETLHLINSKEYSFSLGKPPPCSLLTDSLDEIKNWAKIYPYDFVLKNCFGFSGKGHLIIERRKVILWDKVEAFVAKEIACKRKVILEPWVKRLKDFSTQWFLDEKGLIHYLGSTVCFNDSKGHYQGSLVGEETILFHEKTKFLDEHKAYAKEALNKLKALGYFGHVGLDAMVYECPQTQDVALQPIVEINARKTMGWIALTVFHRMGKDKKIVGFYLADGPQDHKDFSLLPFSCIAEAKKTISFRKNLYLTFNPSFLQR